MSDVRIEWNQDFFDNLLKSGEVEALVEQAANQAANAARGAAPVKTGEYRDSIEVERKEGSSRTWFKVKATAPHAALVESKTGNLHKALGKARI